MRTARRFFALGIACTAFSLFLAGCWRVLGPYAEAPDADTDTDVDPVI